MTEFIKDNWPVITVAANEECNVSLEGFCGLLASAAAPFCRVQDGGFVWLLTNVFTELGDGTNVVVSCDATAGQPGQLNSLESFLRDNCIGGAGATTFLTFADAGTVIGGSLGGSPVGLRDLAPGIAYTPASNANWNNAPPATVAAALNRIAAKIGPIS